MEDRELIDPRKRLQDSEKSFEAMAWLRHDTLQQLGVAETRKRKWAAAIVKLGIDRFPNKEIMAEAEAVLQEVRGIQDDLVAHLKKGGKASIGDRHKEDPFLQWLLSHPNIKNRFVQPDEKEGYLQFWWEEKQ